MGEDGNIGFPCCQRSNTGRYQSLGSLCFPCLTLQASSISVAVLPYIEGNHWRIKECASLDSCLEHPPMVSMLRW